MLTCLALRYLRLVDRVRNALYHRLIYRRLFGHFGEGSFVSPDARIENMGAVFLGDGSSIGRGTLIQPVAAYGGEKYDPHIRIGNRVYIGNGCTLSTGAQLVIGDEVTLGDHVYLATGRHGYEDPSRGVLQQPLVEGSVRIGPRAWLGYGCVVAGNLDIGEHAVIGANSVVLRSVPPFTVVGGNPARPIRQYNAAVGEWERVREECTP